LFNRRLVSRKPKTPASRKTSLYSVCTNTVRCVTRGEAEETQFHFPGHRITMGAPNHSGGAEKCQNCHKYFFQFSKFTSNRAQVRTWGRQTCFLPRALSNLVTPLCTVIVNIKILFDFLVPEILDNTL